MLIADNLCQAIEEEYNLKLNVKRMKWGSISPDFLPKYKIYRHYKEESVDFVAQEMVSLIYFMKLFDLQNLNHFTNKLISTKIGVISHFLCDYVCLPHFERWTCDKCLKKHFQYEKDLNSKATNHSFNRDMLLLQPTDLIEGKSCSLREMIQNYIDQVMIEYRMEDSITKDLDFGLAFSVNMTYFMIQTALSLQGVQNVKSYVY